jgi:hypothetical protein
MLPDFNANGLLPEGIHDAIWDEIAPRFGGNLHRGRLLSGLKSGLEALRIAGCPKVYVDGSFVTAKEVPSDFDCCYEVAGIDPTQLDPVFLDFSFRRAAQKARFLGEFFPAHWPASVTGEVYLDFFQNDPDTGSRKGIVAIDLRRWIP